MKILTSNTQQVYPIYIGENFLKDTQILLEKNLSFEKIAIITDDVVAPLYLGTLFDSFSNKSICVHTIQNGEASKNAENLLQIYDFLTQNKITRSDLIIALGGGVVGDLAGFAAATYLRGIKFVQIPTTLLAQVDSSVGGKTAINITAGKNLVGSFYMPSAVICDTHTLHSLSPLVFADGVSEVIKYACILDAPLFEKITQINIDCVKTEIIESCIGHKIKIVEQDEHDLGLRMILNFGHTIGHAIEKHYNYSKYTHGQAVAIGMVHITSISERMGLTQKGTTDTIITLLKRFDLPTTCNLTAKELFSYCIHDKKNMDNVINLILLKKIGTSFVHKLTVDDFYKFLNS